MKKIFLIIFSIIIISCKGSNKELDSLQGNWNGCDKKGVYVELHVKEKLLEWCPEFEPYGIPYTYELEDNHLITTSLINDQEIRKGKIEFKGEQFILTYISSDEKNDTIIFNRITKPIGFCQDILKSTELSKEEKLGEYLKKYNERLSNKSCVKEDIESLDELKLIK
jgi:hypothetical protein